MIITHFHRIHWEGAMGRGGGTIGIFGWGCATRTPEPIAYTRPSSVQLCYPVLDKLLKSLFIIESLFSRNYWGQHFLCYQTELWANLNLRTSLYWVTISSFPSLNWNLKPIYQFPRKWYPTLDPKSLTSIPFPRLNCLKTIPFTSAHTLYNTINSPFMAVPPPPPLHRDYRGLSKTTKPTEIRQCRSPLIHKLQQSKSIIQTSTLVFQKTPGSLKMKLTFSVNCGELFHQLHNILGTKYSTKMKHQK